MAKRRILRVLGWIMLLIFIGMPMLFLATCAYTSFSPHLLSDPINQTLYNAPEHSNLGWRSSDVALTPNYLQVGQSQEAVTKRLEVAGYELFGDYSTDIGPRDIHLDDDMPQAGLDRMFARAKTEYGALGITHIFGRGGRTRPACGETFFIEVGFADKMLKQASGYTRWTCL